MRRFFGITRQLPNSLFTDDWSSLVQILTAARHRAALTQVELAQKLGRSQRYVSLIETGQRRVDVLEFMAYASALNLDSTDLFNEIRAKIR